MTDNEIINYIKENKIILHHRIIEDGISIFLYQDNIVNLIWNFKRPLLQDNSYTIDFKLTQYIYEEKLTAICLIKGIDKFIILELINKICEEEIKRASKIFSNIPNALNPILNQIKTKENKQ